MLVPKPLILFIDAYDSFSSNIISLLETSLSCTVRTIKIDNALLSSPSLLHAELRHYAAIVCGPGPGHPANPRDVGIMKRIWTLCEEETLPVLGICLGFQSLCLEFGGEVRRLRAPMHGIVRRVGHVGETCEIEAEESVFAGIRDIRATLYHSLCVNIGQDSVGANDWDTWKWMAPKAAPSLLPLAWVEAEEGWTDDERILVAVRHRTKPFWGLQYHPESICTNVESQRVIKNWFKQAQKWNRTNRKYKVEHQGPIRGELAKRESLLAQVLENQSRHGSENISGRCSGLPWELSFQSEGLNCVHRSHTFDAPKRFSVARFMELHGNTKGKCVLLESTNAHAKSAGSADVRGRYSIIGMEAQHATRIEYRVGDDYLTIYQRQLRFLPEKHRAENISLKPYGGIWQFMSHYLGKRRAVGQNNLPFWGGFMGYTTYELGLESIDVESGERNRLRPDLCFVWITRSIVVDHLEGKITVQSLEDNRCFAADDGKIWLDEIVETISNSFRSRSYQDSEDRLESRPDISSLAISTPSDTLYQLKVSRCQDYIRSGDSYELCLTDQTTVNLPRVSRKHLYNHIQAENEKGGAEHLRDSAWFLYKNLRKRQPAPFASYIHLGSATLVSSSPERFLTWDNQSGTCSLRPMKGTVKKSSSVISLAQATALLQVPKEQAENLMIVDLVRHDLHSVLGSGNVIVPRLMVVEEYASVFQMISIVEGRIPPVVPHIEDSTKELEAEESQKKRYTGIDVLAASLPPGSMTGAPKKRSCEILREIEGGRDRSLYSGVVGYMDVGGRGDFSVTIRCMFRWDDEGKEEGKEVWHIGAGGAVTALSTPVGEREEMLTKLSGTLGVFD